MTSKHAVFDETAFSPDISTDNAVKESIGYNDLTYMFTSD